MKEGCLLWKRVIISMSYRREHGAQRRWDGGLMLGFGRQLEMVGSSSKIKLVFGLVRGIE